jgi:uncharacterized damage-inducible protein DinB
LKTADLAELYEYLIESRRRFLEKFRALGWDIVNQNREASQYSMHGILIHMLEVEDSWLHYDIPGKTWPFGDRDPSAFKDFEGVVAYHNEVARKTRRLIASLADNNLDREVVFETGAGQAKSTVEHILLHTFVDEVAHLGELVCLMWQLDQEPPFINWISRHHERV